MRRTTSNSTYEKLTESPDLSETQPEEASRVTSLPRSRPTSAKLRRSFNANATIDGSSSSMKLRMPEGMVPLNEESSTPFNKRGSILSQSMHSIVDSLLGSGTRLKEFDWKPSEGRAHCGRRIADSQDVALICGIAQALFRYGAPLSRVEHLTASAAAALDIPLTIQCLPEILMMSIGDGSLLHPTRTHFLKVSKKLSMGKLHDVDQLAIKIINSNDLTSLPKTQSFIASPSAIFTSLGINNKSDTIKRGLFTAFTDKTYEEPESDTPDPPPPTHKEVTIDDSRVQELLHELDEIVARPKPYSLATMVFSGAIHSSTLAMLNYSGSYGDGLIAFLLGGFATYLIERVEQTSSQGVPEILVAIIGNGGKLEGSWAVLFDDQPACQYVYALSSLIRLFPGMQTVLGMLEMTENPVSGSVRFFQSFVRSLKLGYGLSIGSKLGVFILATMRFEEPDFGDKVGLSPHCPSDFSQLFLLNFERMFYSFSFAVGSYINLEAKPSQFLKIIGASVLSFMILTLARNVNPVDVAAGMSAFVVASSANLWPRIQGEIAVPFILSAVQYLGPGSLGVIGAANMFADDAGSGGGSSFALDMIVRAMSIALGEFYWFLCLGPLQMMKDEVKNKKMLARLLFARRISHFYHHRQRFFSTQQTPSSDKQPKKGIKDLIAEHGPAALVTYAGLSLVSFAGFYTAIVSSGLSAEDVMQRLPFDWTSSSTPSSTDITSPDIPSTETVDLPKSESDPSKSQTNSDSSNASSAGTALVAFAVHELFLPVRLGLTAALTPRVAARMKGTRLDAGMRYIGTSFKNVNASLRQRLLNVRSQFGSSTTEGKRK
ncbi:hypothetical protein BJ741DRAFT_632529 [Chytriomyces cf. hyalinus JEL632]|nr:hypothetical protein BJ741DRAFT_632529 [Chytriomyces cf. hyalinus JEL632]